MVEAVLAGWGLVRVDVPADGDCLMHALIVSAPAAFPPGTGPAQVRQVIRDMARVIFDDPGHDFHDGLDRAIRSGVAEQEVRDREGAFPFGLTEAEYRANVYEGTAPGDYRGPILEGLARNGDWDGPAGDVALFIAAPAYGIRLTVVTCNGGVHELSEGGGHRAVLVQVRGHWHAAAPASSRPLAAGQQQPGLLPAGVSGPGPGGGSASGDGPASDDAGWLNDLIGGADDLVGDGLGWFYDFIDGIPGGLDDLVGCDLGGPGGAGSSGHAGWPSGLGWSSDSGRLDGLVEFTVGSSAEPGAADRPSSNWLDGLFRDDAGWLDDLIGDDAGWLDGLDFTVSGAPPGDEPARAFQSDERAEGDAPAEQRRRARGREWRGRLRALAKSGDTRALEIIDRQNAQSREWRERLTALAKSGDLDAQKIIDHHNAQRREWRERLTALAKSGDVDAQEKIDLKNAKQREQRKRQDSAVADSGCGWLATQAYRAVSACGPRLNF